MNVCAKIKGFCKSKVDSLCDKSNCCRKGGDNGEESQVESASDDDNELDESRSDDTVAVNRIRLVDLLQSEILRSPIKVNQVHSKNRTFVIRDSKKRRLDSI